MLPETLECFFNGSDTFLESHETLLGKKLNFQNKAIKKNLRGKISEKLKPTMASTRIINFRAPSQ